MKKQTEGKLVRWWEKPRARARQGDLARQKGCDLTIECPKCRVAPVVYNGNYFCDSWGGECDWVLAHPATSKADREVCDLVGIDYG